MLVRIQLDIAKEVQQSRHIHAQQFMDILSSYLHIQSLLAQAAATAFAADSPAGVAVEHILILYLVSVRLDPLEELVKADHGLFLCLGLAAFPDQVLDLLAQIAVWLENRYVIFYRILYELILEPSHLVSPPACYGSVIDGFALVRHDKIFAYAYDLSQAATDRACSQRTVEAEKIFVRPGELHPVGLEPVDELLHHRFLARHLLSYI